METIDNADKKAEREAQLKKEGFELHGTARKGEEGKEMEPLKDECSELRLVQVKIDWVEIWKKIPTTETTHVEIRDRIRAAV